MGYFDGGFTVSDVFQNQLSETWATQQYFLPYFRNNVLLITGYPSTTTFISDSSANGFNLNVIGDTRVTTSNPYETNWSNYFDGTGDYLSISHSTSLSWIGTVDGSVEAWVYMNSFTGSPTITSKSDISGSSYANFSLAFNTSGNLLGFVGNSGSPGSALATVTSATTVPLNTWTHVAFTRRYVGGGAQNEYRVFINGVLQGSTTAANPTDARAGVCAIGATTSGTVNPLTGYISNLRFSNNSIPPAYQTTSTTNGTTVFTPPTAPLTAISGTSLLTCQSNRFKDNSSNNFTITQAGDVAVNKFNPFTSNYLNYGSAYFDGTGDWIQTASSALFGFGTGAFTIECWLYWIGGSGENTLVCVDVTNGVNIFLNSSGWGIGTRGVAVNNQFGTAPTKNVWHHIAVSRSGSTIYAFIDGVLVYSGANSTDYQAAGPLGIAAIITASGNIINGYINNLRVVKGTAVYSGNFTPPIAPLLPMGTTTIYSSTANVNTTFSSANTSLLTLQTSRPHNNHTFFDNSPFNNLITRTGNPNQGTFSPYGANWSNYFDGTGDYLTVPANAAFAMGTGDFTFEVWLYANIISTGTFDRICATSDYNGSGFDWALNTSSSAFYLAGTSYNIGSIVPGVWHHLVYTRSGSNIRGFLNGNLSSYATGATQNISSVTQLNIGTGYSGTALNGYLSGLRIIKGSIPTEYQTSSTTTGTQIFTPPTSQLTAISGTSLLTCQSSRFKDDSTNNFIITQVGDASVQKFSPYEPSPPFSDSTQFLQSSLVGGSGAFFTGQSNYVTVPAQVLSGDYTIESWIYYTATSTYGTIVSTNTSSLELLITSGGAGVYYTGGSIRITTSLAFNKNSWNHIALVRNGGVTKIYMNGVADAATYSSSADIGAAGEFYYLARDPGVSSGYTGYYSDIRIIKGTAVYTGNFAPPVAPLLSSGTSTTYTSTANINTTFAAANTTLLLNFANAAVKDYSGISTIEHTGNVRLVSNVSKYGGTAVYFDGLNGTQLKVSKLAANNPPTTVVGTANLTAEMWVYPLAMTAGTSYSLFTLGSETTGRYTATIQNGQIKTNYYGAATANIGGNVQPNVWSHIAIVKQGSNIAGYVNGVRLPNTETNSSSIGNGGANIGSDGSGTAVFFGYIDDVRITNGNVRYTANFNVPNQLVIP